MKIFNKFFIFRFEKIYVKFLEQGNFLKLFFFKNFDINKKFFKRKLFFFIFFLYKFYYYDNFFFNKFLIIKKKSWIFLLLLYLFFSKKNINFRTLKQSNIKIFSNFFKKFITFLNLSFVKKDKKISFKLKKLLKSKFLFLYFKYIKYFYNYKKLYLKKNISLYSLYQKVRFIRLIFNNFKYNLKKLLFFFSYILYILVLKKKLKKFKRSYKYTFTNYFLFTNNLIFYIYFALILLLKINIKNFSFLKKFFIFCSFFIFKWYLFKFLKKKYLLFYTFLYQTYAKFFKMKLYQLYLNKYINFYIFKKLSNIHNLNIKLKINLLTKYLITSNLLVYYWFFKISKRFKLYNLVWRFFKKFLKKNFFINGFYIKGVGRFTRRQRSSIYKYQKGALNFRSYNVNVILTFIDLITRYGKCTIKVFINYNLRFLINKNIFGFYFL